MDIRVKYDIDIEREEIEDVVGKVDWDKYGDDELYDSIVWAMHVLLEYEGYIVRELEDDAEYQEEFIRNAYKHALKELESVKVVLNP